MITIGDYDDSVVDENNDVTNLCSQQGDDNDFYIIYDEHHLEEATKFINECMHIRPLTFFMYSVTGFCLRNSELSLE